MKWSILAFLLLALAGCGGGNRLDASSDESTKASMKSMTEKMTPEQKAEFAADCAVMTSVKAGEIHGRRKPGPPDASLLMKDLDGLTAAQIHEKAESARADLKTRQAAGAKKK